MERCSHLVEHNTLKHFDQTKLSVVLEVRCNNRLMHLESNELVKWSNTMRNLLPHWDGKIIDHTPL